MSRRFGQSMTEYGLIGASLGLVAVAALALLGNNLSGLFDAMLSKPKPVQTANAPAPTSPAEALQTPAPVPAPATGGNTVITLENGQQLSLNMPDSVAQSVQTIGANGTTDLLASNLTAMANQLLEKGEITQDQANSLIKLANQAHHMAEIQKILEKSSAEMGNDVTAFKSTPVTIDGVTYPNSYEAALSIGMDDNNASAKGPELQKFWDLFSDAFQANYTLPQELKDVLQYHATTINNLSDSMRIAMRNIIEHDTGTPSDLQNMMTDQLIHSESTNICHMESQNQDSGVHCSKKG